MLEFIIKTMYFGLNGTGIMRLLLRIKILREEIFEMIVFLKNKNIHTRIAE